MKRFASVVILALALSIGSASLATVQATVQATPAEAYTKSPHKHGATDHCSLRRIWTVVYIGCDTLIQPGTVHDIAERVRRYENASVGAIAGAFAVACAATGVAALASAFCAAFGGILGGYAVDQFIYADKKAVCIKISRAYAPMVPTPVGYDLSPSTKAGCILPKAVGRGGSGGGGGSW